MSTQPRSAFGVTCTLVGLMAIADASAAHAQTTQGQSTHQYFRNGAAATSAPPAGQPGAEFFSRGADATSVPTQGQPGADYFSNGAHNNGADVTSVHRAGQGSSDDYFNRGADITSVPRPGQPGAEFFSRGADVTSVPATAAPEVEAIVAVEPAHDTPDEPVAAPEPTPEAVEEEDTDPEDTTDEGTTDEASLFDDAIDGIVELLPAWPRVVAWDPDTDGTATDATPALDRTAELDNTTSPPNVTEAGPSLFDRLQSAVHHLAFGVRVLVVAIAASITLLAFTAWRTFKRGKDEE